MGGRCVEWHITAAQRGRVSRKGWSVVLMRPSQVEEEEGLEKTIKLNELRDGFS